MTDQFSFKAAPQTRPRSADPEIAKSQASMDAQDAGHPQTRRKRRTRAELEAAGVKSRPRTQKPSGLAPDLVALKKCVSELRTLSAEDAQRVFVTLEALFR